MLSIIKQQEIDYKMRDLELRITMYDIRNERNNIMKDNIKLQEQKVKMRWTKDRLEWLIKSKEIYNDREDILNAFNKYFNVNVSLALLSKNNYKYKLDLPRATRIITRCLEMGWVKRRGFSRRDSDYTQEYVNGNRTFIKIDNAKTKDGFVPKHRYLYEKISQCKT